MTAQIVQIINPWIYKGVSYGNGDLVQMSEELAAHLFETSVVQYIPLAHKAVLQVFVAFISGRGISDKLKSQLEWVESEDRVHFWLALPVGEESPRRFNFHIYKDTNKCDLIEG